MDNNINNDKIACMICGSLMNQISHSHLKSHGLTTSEYKLKFPNAPTRSKSAIKRKKESAKKANEHRKGIPRTKETIRKIKESKKINPPVAWNKGISMLDEQKEKISQSKKEKYKSGEIVHWNIGNKTSLTTKQKISETLKIQQLTFSEKSKEKRKLTLEEKKKNGWVHHNTRNFFKKLNNSTKHSIEDKNWLYQKHVIEKHTIASICVMLGLHWKEQASTVSRKMKKMGIPIYSWTGKNSAQQSELEDFLSSLNVEYITNTRKIISPYELDIYIPKFNIAIEYNGLYWHSEANGKNSNYHLMKTELCEKQGIRLIHIFEDEWTEQQDKCKDTIKHLLGKSQKGVYARNCNVREITWKEAKPFLNKYHLLNAGTAGNYNIGAFDKNNNLIGVMVFGHSNIENSNKNTIELKRFITNKKNNPGLGSKMFKFAIREKGYEEIIAFVDRRWFTGLVKEHIGFELIGTSSPSIWWTNGKERYHRRFISKRQLIREGHDKSKSKHEILLSLGFSRIWDCGKLKLKWNNTT